MVLSISNLAATETALKVMAESVSNRLEVAKNLACSEETKGEVKKFRATLKKDFEDLERERKARTAEYEEPLKRFKALYDQYITAPYKAADVALKAKIDEVEAAQKAKKREAIETYATELLQMYALDWLDVNRIIPAVTLSTSEKSLKEAVKSVVEKIRSDVECIKATDDSEMFAEYMNCLDIGKAKITVLERQRAIEAAKKATVAYEEQEAIDKEAEKKIEQLAPPTVVPELEEKTYTMTFTVSGTIKQLRALKTFMTENNIEFKNGGNNNE